MDTPNHRRRRGLEPLEDLPVLTKARVVSVFERDRQLLEYLDALGVRPGTRLSVVSRNYDETLTLRVNGRMVQLGRPAAGKVWVRKG
jgi:DtxR family Mn-dependent transcriptional regulator